MAQNWTPRAGSAKALKMTEAQRLGSNTVPNLGDLGFTEQGLFIGDGATALSGLGRVTKAGDLILNAMDVLPAFSRDVDAINASVLAADAIYNATGSRVSVLVPGKKQWNLQRYPSTTGNVGGITWLPGLAGLYGQGTRLRIGSDSHFIYAESTESGVSTTITANTAVGDTTLTVSSSAGFTVGQRLYIRIGQAAYDQYEPDHWLFPMVTAVPDATHVTIDQPVGYALNVSAVSNVNQRRIAVIDKWIPDMVIDGFNFVNDMSVGVNAESGMRLFKISNATIRNISATNPGAGIVYAQMVTNLTGDNWRVGQAASQNGQASKGRIVNFAEVRTASIRNVHASNFQSNFAVLEGACENVEFDGVHINNNNADRNNAVTPLIAHLGNCRARWRNVYVRGNSAILYGDGGTLGSTVQFDNLTDRTTGGMTLPDISVIGGEYRRGDSVYRETKRFSKQFALTPSMSGVNLDLPSGLARRLRINASSTTGITNLYLSNKTTNATEIKSQLVAGSTVSILGMGSSPSGTTYKFNDYEGKRLIIYTDSTVPANATLTVEIEYFLPSGGADDGSGGRVDVPLAPTSTGGGLTPNMQFFTASGTWTKPAGSYTFADIEVLAAGGGGGSGNRGAASTTRTGGAGGGGGGYTRLRVPFSLLNATETVTVGVGGTGGAAVTTDSTNGAAGGNGGATTFGNHVRAMGGNGGGGGSAAVANGGAAGYGLILSGAGGSSSASGGVGGGGGQASGPAGGGAGGGISTSNVYANGQSGGNAYVQLALAAGNGGLSDGAAGSSVAAASDPTRGLFSPGPGGGASSLTGPGGAGGSCNGFGAGGAGGGASVNGQPSGAGGNGGGGYVRITCV